MNQNTKATTFKRLQTQVFSSSELGSIAIANEIANLIKKKQSQNKTCVLGLATGSSPIRVYKELIRLHQKENLSFKNVVTFNLDEYFPMSKNNKHSYYHFMHQHLFNHIDIPANQINIPNGELNLNELPEYCAMYESKIAFYGGIDFQLLGIGRTGHIGFNEPGSHFNSKTRLVTLNPITRTDASIGFGSIDNVPKQAITIGVQTIYQAKRIVLMAWGHKKAIIIKAMVEGNVHSDIPVTFLQSHTNTNIVLDTESCKKLKQLKTT